MNADHLLFFTTPVNVVDHFLTRMCVSYNFLYRLLEELLVSLQWGRQQTYYPSAQPHSTGELATVNLKLARAVTSHLLGNKDKTNSPTKVSSPTEFCNTPAEKMAEMVKTLSCYNQLNLTFKQ